MQPLNLSNYKIEKKEPKNWFEETEALAKRLNRNVWDLRKHYFAGWKHDDLKRWIISVESKAKDDNISFQFAFNCMWKKKEVVDK